MWKRIDVILQGLCRQKDRPLERHIENNHFRGGKGGDEFRERSVPGDPAGDRRFDPRLALK